jgi:hypothetical protein
MVADGPLQKAGPTKATKSIRRTHTQNRRVGRPRAVWLYFPFFSTFANTTA